MTTTKSAILILLLLYPFIVSASLLVPISSTLTKHHKQCSDIESHPDQCAFVITTCHGFSGVFLKFYYCSTVWKPFSVIMMLSGLLLLFGAVSVVAADFFCPNLQTISSRLQLSESMAGVTVLAFGNGSPDLFSTFTAMNSGSGSLAIGELIGAAFFIVSVVSGCMGIIRPFKSKRITFMRDASFLAGAIIILTWIVYHQRICWYHGVILIGYYITYVAVVVMGAYRFPRSETPILEPKYSQIIIPEMEPVEEQNESSPLLKRNTSQLRLDIPIHGYSSQEHLGHIIRPVSPNSSHHLSRRSSLHLDFPRTTSTNGSISSRLYRHALSPRIGMRTSLFSAIAFQEQITTIKRANSTQLYQNDNLKNRHTQISVPCISTVRSRQESADHVRTPDDYFTYISTNTAAIPEITLETSPPPVVINNNDQQQDNRVEEVIEEEEEEVLVTTVQQVFYTLFPTLNNWKEKTTFAKLSSLVAAPLILVFTLTLPIAEQDDVKVDDIEVIEEPVSTAQVAVVDNTAEPPTKSYLTVPIMTSDRSLDDLFVIEEQEQKLSEETTWCRWLVALQAICSTTFVTSVMVLNGFVPAGGIFFGALVGCCISVLVYIKTNPNKAPSWHWILSFVGFVIALNWIFLLANEMVGLLQALGTIFDISEAIMGLTIFALGNSVGDFVANTAIAKMGFPTMAISACYAGPLLNMVLGVGISSTYQTWMTGKAYELDIAPTILISSAGLITVLLSTLIVVNINGYHITKQLGWWMIIVYSICTVVNIFLEFHILI